MELGNKIAKLRQQAKLTQKQLADILCISAQSVSKWETLDAKPDITLLPKIAETFGVTIDDLFDLTIDERLNRIERRLDIERDLSSSVFEEYESYLLSLLEDKDRKERATGLLAQLYGRRMLSDREKVHKYATEAILMNPGKKEHQWLLGEFDGHANWDWNISNHSRAIDFYKGIVEKNPSIGLPYLYLMDNLLADNRVDEAEEYIGRYEKLDRANKLLADFYKVHITWIRKGGEEADKQVEALAREYPDHEGFLFEAAQYYAKRAKYDKAIAYYEVSFEKDPKRPRYIDPLMAISDVYVIQGEYQKAADTYERIIQCLREEWGLSEDYFELKDSIEKKRLLQEKAKNCGLN